MKKIGIIGAMAVEVALLKEKMTQLTVTEHCGIEFFDGILEETPCVVVQCGVGKVNAALCVQLLCDCYGISHIINTGVAGSLDENLDIGDFVISRDAVYHDFDVSPLGYALGQVPGLNVREFPADEGMISCAMLAAEQVCSGHAYVGRVASGDQFVSAKQQKQKIIADTGAACTEMEGAAIAHAAWRNEIPFVILRAISDKADDSAQMDYPTFEAIAAKRCAAVVQAFVKLL